MLHFPSPSNNADVKFIFESDNIHSRDYGRGQANIMDNFITIRVFLKVTNDLTHENLKKLFAKSVES